MYLINILFCAVPMYSSYCAAPMYSCYCAAPMYSFLRLVIQFCAPCSLFLDPTLALFVFLSRPNHIISNHPYSYMSFPLIILENA